MVRTTDDNGATGAEEAINRVLEAERRAGERVAGCEAQAAAELGAARERARRIAERTDTRITRLRTRCEQIVAVRVAQLKASAEAVRCQPLTEDERAAQLAAAVARLATRLSGGEP